MTNPFVQFTAVERATIRLQYKQVLLDIAAAGQSYSVPGRTFTRVEIGKVNEVLSLLADADNQESGRQVRFAKPVMRYAQRNR